MQLPDAVARAYAADLIAHGVKPVGRAIRQRLVPVYERELARRDDSTRTDAHPFADILSGVLVEVARELTEAEMAAVKHGEEIAGVNGEALGMTYGSALGIDVVASEPWLAPLLESWRRSNVSLIRRLPERHVADVDRLVEQAWSRGLLTADLQDQLQERLGISARRAERIARDQTGKLNGQLTMVRQASLGVERYRWMTSIDERVRQTHADRHGLWFTWDAPPADGHPGFPIQCRCQAEGDIEGTLAALEQDIPPDVDVDLVNALIGDSVAALGTFADDGIADIVTPSRDELGASISELFGSSPPASSIGRGRSPRQSPRAPRQGRAPRGRRR